MNVEDCELRIARELCGTGISPGDTILVHSSLSSLGYVPGGAEMVVGGLVRAVGPDGTLLMPALSYQQRPHHVHDTRRTPSNVGAIPEHFRLRPGTVRSVHPTHSVCGIGRRAVDLLSRHAEDSTPCGPSSPLNLMLDIGAKIVMLGCGLRPNTTMHALEEYVEPVYLFGELVAYTITDNTGRTFTKVYARHGFKGWKQRYDRVALLPGSDEFVRHGRILHASVHVVDGAATKAAVLGRLRADPLFFVDRLEPARDAGAAPAV